MSAKARSNRSLTSGGRRSGFVRTKPVAQSNDAPAPRMTTSGWALLDLAELPLGALRAVEDNLRWLVGQVRAPVPLIRRQPACLALGSLGASTTSGEAMRFESRS